MSNVKALIVGVSNYYLSGANDLPFCMNDITIMENALLNGLKLDYSDIITCGNLGELTKNDFEKAFSEMVTRATNKDDTLIFYFSGHGTTLKDNQHYLVFSDGLLSTQKIIRNLKDIPIKSKIIILDCCHSGNFSIDGTSSLNIEKTVSEFQGEGYAVLASSKSEEVSFGHPDKPTSLFTSFLCDALQDRLLIRDGKVSLNDIQRLVSLYLDVWNKKSTYGKQHPIFRANMGGTIYFKVQEFQPFYSKNVYLKSDKYIIYKVKPLHTGQAKRYATEVILKEPFSFEEINKIYNEIINVVKNVEVYNNKKSKDKWTGKIANIIWVYFGRDENDMISSNFICHTTWVDDKQDKAWWYKVNNRNTFILGGTHFNVHSYYEHLKIFNQNNLGNKNELIIKTKELLSHLVTLAENVISLFNEYKNGILTEVKLVKQMAPFIQEINEYYIKSHDLDIPPIDIKVWSEACSILFGTVFDFTLYYNKHYMSQRTSDNRKVCMEMAIKQYYADLESVGNLEEQLL
ncbi:caspase family protein [Bacillus massilinigeriensis]|uniref:caspase family protein n=1 Tax=Bacillus massilionigeriensis TaxID=1805475 RepID=UPI00096B0B06|nr:caspase family protein [Bacillus massilionigeriensis]